MSGAVSSKARIRNCIATSAHGISSRTSPNIVPRREIARSIVVDVTHPGPPTSSLVTPARK
jgi:hypothetical protein